MNSTWNVGFRERAKISGTRKEQYGISGEGNNNEHREERGRMIWGIPFWDLGRNNRIRDIVRLLDVHQTT
jgi:hypothetical protein